MENRNIYKMDDVLLVLSLILLAPAIFFAWPWLKGIPDAKDIAAYVRTAPSVLGQQLLYVLSYLAGALLTQIAGRVLRYQEKLSLKILDEVGYARKVRISELSSRLGMSEGKVEKLVRKLSRVSSLNIGIEGDRIVRSRKTAARAGWDRGGESRNDGAQGRQERVVETRDSETRDSETRDSGARESWSRVEIRTESKGEENFDSLFEQMEKSGKAAHLKNQGIDLVSIMEQMKKTGEKPDLKKLHQMAGASGTAAEKGSGSMPFGCLGMGILILLFMTPLWPIPLVILIRKAVKQRGMSQSEEL